MSSDFIKALLISVIVFGFETLFIGVLLMFRPNFRTQSFKYLLRGGFYIIFFLAAFLLFKRGLILENFSLLLLFLVFSFASLMLEGVLNRNLKTVLAPADPMNQETWRKGKATKRQFVLIITLGFGWILVTPAIVFTIVAPEVLPVYWWPILIVMLGFIGFVCASLYWSSNEKKFGSKSPSSQQ